MTENGISHKLQVSQEEKDLGIYIADNLKPGLQCAKAAFGKNDIESFQLLYKSYVRPHMEYCVQAWSPYLVKDNECLEKVQRRANKMVRGLDHMSYDKLGLLSDEQRRLRGDLIEAYKILNGKDIVDKATFFQLSPTVSTLRGHNMKLFIPWARLHVQKYFFSHRVVSHWNSLPQHVVNAPSVNSFKSRLYTYWHDMDVKSR